MTVPAKDKGMATTLMEIRSALQILDTTTDAVIVINRSGVIQLANNAVSDMFGYVPEEVVGQSVAILMPKTHAKNHFKYIQRYLDTQEKRVIDTGREVECVHKDGSTFFSYLSVLEYHIDEDVLFAGVLRDITEMKRREADLEKKNRELKQSNELLERFAYISAHDLKTPLRSMTGLLNNACRMFDKYVKKGVQPDPEKLTKTTDLINQGIHKMAATIDDTLRYCSAGQDLKLAWHSLDSLLNNAMESAQAMIEEENVYIDKEKARIDLFCDGAQMTQAFYNLITNAIKYNDSECKTIRIDAYKQGEDAMIHVADNGRGIPEDQQHKVFELFQKLQTEGSGVGGAIVDRVVKGHNGTISIDSIVGQGTTFNIKLPIKDS